MVTTNSKVRYQNIPSYYGDPTWLIHDRFGLFIHWGLYAVAARHEWVMNREEIHPDVYQKYFNHFDPDLFDPKIWAKAAKDAGMKYFVITTKHHEGFALWDSALTEFKATRTPAKRDLLKEVVNAFREEGLKIGFYHSLIDWHHAEFTVDRHHPQRNNEVFKEHAKDRDMSKYVEFLHGQVRELLTNYGKIDYLWFDFSYEDKGKEAWKSEELEKLVFELQPHIILNDRLDLGKGVVTPEQYQPKGPLYKEEKPVLWEACQTLNGSWGYDRDNLDWKSDDMLIKMLIDTVSKGGNLLLNVGPNGRGEFDPRSLASLQAIGNWLRLHNRSIYGAKESEFQAPADCRFTQKGNRLYLHIFSWPFKHIHLEGLAGKIDYAQLLHDASEVHFSEYGDDRAQGHTTHVVDSGSVVLELPVQKPNVVVPVVELFLKNH